MKIIRKNIFFIVLFFCIGICIWKKDNFLDMPIVTHADAQIAFSTEKNVLEQTWQSNVKRISKITVAYAAKTDFCSKMKLQILDDNGSDVLAESIIDCAFRKGEKGQLSFDFGEIPLTVGERYRIQLSYVNPSDIGAILLDAGSNYIGCSIDKEEVGMATAFNIVFIKSSRLFWLMISFFPIMAFSLLFMSIWNRKWEETAGISFISMIFVMYIFGLFGKLETGIHMVYFLSIVSLLVALVWYNKKQMTIRDLTSPGLVVYGVLVVLILINCNGAFMARWDEYSHWGLAAKDMFCFDAFSKHIDTTVMLTRYPPFATLAEYFFNYTNGLFSQSLVYVGFQTALLNMLILICKVANKKLKLLWPSLVVMLGVPIIFFYDAYNSLYVDVLLAVLVAYVLFCYFSEENSLFSWMRIAGGLFALTLSKESGVILAGVLCLIILTDIIWRQWKEHKLIKKQLVISISTLLMVGMFFLSWQIYLRMPVEEIKREKAYIESSDVDETDSVNETGESFEVNVPSASNAISASGITIDGILNLLTGEGPEYQYKVAKNFIKMLFSDNSYQIGSISFSYIDLFIVMLILAGFISTTKKWEDKKFINFIILTFSLGMIYVAFLLVTYLFSFSEKEALILHSNGRYLGSYLCGVILAFLGLLLTKTSEIETFDQKGTTWKVILCMTAILLIGIPFDAFFIKNMDTEITEDEVYGYDDMAEVLRSFAKQGESVYFVCNNSGGYAYYMFRNTISPLLIANDGWDIFASREAYLTQCINDEVNGIEIKGSPTFLSAEAWKEELQNVDYVFLFHVNDMFKISYQELFDTEVMKDGSFYRVVKKNDEIRLDYIGSVGIKTYR